MAKILVVTMDKNVHGDLEEIRNAGKGCEVEIAICPNPDGIVGFLKKILVPRDGYSGLLTFSGLVIAMPFDLYGNVDLMEVVEARHKEGMLVVQIWAERDFENSSLISRFCMTSINGTLDGKSLGPKPYTDALEGMVHAMLNPADV